MATCCLSHTGAIFVLLAISKPCIRFWWSLYRFRPKSTHLSSGTLGFPSWVQVQSFLVKSCICMTYRVPHSIPCFASCCLCISRDWLWFRCLCSCLGGDEFMNDEPVEYASEDQAFNNSENLAGKMTTPRNHFYLCFASCSFYCHASYLPLAISCLPYCHVSL